MELLVSLISGAVGGNIAGGLFKNLNQGIPINSLAGIIGGGVGGTVLTQLLNVDASSLAGQVGAGGVGGGIVLLAVGALKNMMSNS